VSFEALGLLMKGKLSPPLGFLTFNLENKAKQSTKNKALGNKLKFLMELGMLFSGYM